MATSRSEVSKPVRFQGRRALRTTGTLVALLFGIGPLGCRQDAPPDPGDSGWLAPRGVVLISVEALRAREALAAPGPGGNRLRELAAQGLSFTRAYSPSSLAQQSSASFQVGRLPTRAGAIGVYESQPPGEAATLSVRLRRAGAQTGWIANSPWAGREGFTRGYDLVEVAPEEGWSTSETVQRALRSLDFLAESDQPFLLSVHVEGPASALPQGLAELDEEAGSDRSRTRLRQSYTEALTTTLNDLVPLFDGVDQLAQSADVLLVLVGNNGYELYEHEGVGAGWTVYEESIAVPLILRWPARIEPAEVSTPASTLGLAATLVELFGGRPKSSELDSSSLLRLEGSAYVAEGSQSPPVAEIAVREWAISRAVIGERLKYIHTTKTAPPADRAALERGIEDLQAAMLSGAVATPELFGRPVEELLFDLEKDPNEVASRLDEAPPELAELRRALRAYRDLCDTDAYAPPEITRRLEIDPDQVVELESLGYL